MRFRLDLNKANYFYIYLQWSESVICCLLFVIFKKWACFDVSESSLVGNIRIKTYENKVGLRKQVDSLWADPKFTFTLFFHKPNISK